MSGCKPKDYGEILDRQIGNIESYVAQYPYNIQGGVYVIVKQIGEADAPVPEYGDLITFNYIESTFTTKPDIYINTNRPEIAEQAGLDIPTHLLVPEVIEWGVTPLIPGLRGALMWATKGEIIEAIVPFNLGYDDKWNNVVAPYTALAFEIEIIDIEKKK